MDGSTGLLITAREVTEAAVRLLAAEAERTRSEDALKRSGAEHLALRLALSERHVTAPDSPDLVFARVPRCSPNGSLLMMVKGLVAGADPGS